MRKSVDLSRRRDRILEAPKLDLEALTVLAADYEAAQMSRITAELKKFVQSFARTSEYIIDKTIEKE